MAFYKPRKYTLNRKPIIIYADDSIQDWDDFTMNFCCREVKRVFLNNSSISTLPADYYIAIVWSYEGNTCIDLWRYYALNEWNSGPLSKVYVFCEGRPYDKMGDCSGNEQIMLGREEEYRRECGEDGFDKFLETRPELPAYLVKA